MWLTANLYKTTLIRNILWGISCIGVVMIYIKDLFACLCFLHQTEVTVVTTTNYLYTMELNESQSHDQSLDDHILDKDMALAPR